jgi:hypothetical protein
MSDILWVKIEYSWLEFFRLALTYNRVTYIDRGDKLSDYPNITLRAILCFKGLLSTMIQ